MKNVSSALLTLLNSNLQFRIAEFYTITLSNGSVLAYSNADLSLTYNIAGQSVTGGTVYNPLGGMRVSRDQIKTMVGTQVDEMNITLFPDTTDTINGGAVPFEVINGVLDGAWVSVDRAFLTGWNSASIVGTVNIFAGRVADSVSGRTSVKLTVKSPLELLNLNMPRNVYQPGCMHNLFDAGCTLNVAAYTVGGQTVGSFPQPTAINSSLKDSDSSRYVLGYVTFVTGVLAGQSRSILGWNNVTGAITFGYPFPQAPAVGDVFTATAGCDHQQSTCSSKFNNLVNFRGMPYVPQPETAT